MAITAQEVNKLRQMTGAGMMDCKKALTEANGDFDAAIENLRKKGQKVSASRSDRETTEGAVFVHTNDGNTVATLIALSCETDFVAKNSSFQELGQKILSLAEINHPQNVEALLNLSYDNETVQNHLLDLMAKIGEKVEVSHYTRLSGEQVVSYVHAGAKLGVLVSLKNTGGTDVQSAGRDVAMQIAAMNPVALHKDEVDSSIVEREIEIGKEQARAEGKPEEMLERIAQGKLGKFYKENTLLEQSFVKDPKQSVAQMLNEVHKGLTVESFIRSSVA